MTNAISSEDCELLLSADAPHVPEIPSVGADRRKARFVLPLVGAIAAVGAIGIWSLGSRGHDVKAMPTAALVQEYNGQTTAYGYKDVGKGGCLLPNGDAIAGEYSGIKENRAQDSCDADPNCKGYVVSSGCRGAFLYNNPDGTVKGGGAPPKDSYTWRNQPCMAKDLDMVYTKLGYGKCITADGAEPKNEFLEDVQDNGVTCRQRCSADPTCLGFSAATVNFRGCYLWKEGNLKAGGRRQRWNVASCYTKESAGNPDDEKPAPATTPKPPAPAPIPSGPAPTGDAVKYTDLGKGKCANADGTRLKHKWFGRGSEQSLQKKCNKDSACYGYSASWFGGGLLWMEGGLQGGGDSWGNCKCMVKA